MAMSLRLSRAHMALADETRVRVFDLLCDRPQSVKELAAGLGVAPDRLYYHLRRLEAGGLVRVAELRATADGRAERVYAVNAAAGRGPGEVVAETADRWVLVDAMLAATRIEIDRLAAHGSRLPRRDLHKPRVTVYRGQLALAPAELAELTRRIAALVEEYAGLAAEGPRSPVQYLFTAYERVPPAAAPADA